MKIFLLISALVFSFPAFALNTNVGIGTTTPVNKLTIVGDGTGIAQIGGSTGCGGNYTALTLGITTTTSACNNYNLLSSPTDQELYLNRPTGHSMHFRENNSDQMVLVGGTGNVGIGTASPSQRLDVQGTGIPVVNFGSSTNCCSVTNGTIGLSEQTNSNGRLASIQFHDAGFQEAYIRLQKTDRTIEIGDTQGTGSAFALMNPAGSSRSVYLSQSGSSYFNSGSVGIGKTNPAYPLDVYNPANGTAIYGTANGGASCCGYGVEGHSGSYYGNIGRADGYAFVGVGAVWATGASYFNQSDGRLKENVQPLEGSMERLLKLRPVTYQWKPGTVSYDLQGSKSQIGLIAQEVKEVYPEAVLFNDHPGDSKLKNGKPSLDSQLKGNYGVAYAYLVPVVIKGIQEVWRELQAMKMRVDAIYVRFQGNDAAVKGLQARLAMVQQENAMIKEYICTKDPKSAFCEVSERPE